MDTFATSLDISEALDVPHRRILHYINKHQIAHVKGLFANSRNNVYNICFLKEIPMNVLIAVIGGSLTNRIKKFIGYNAFKFPFEFLPLEELIEREALLKRLITLC